MKTSKPNRDKGLRKCGRCFKLKKIEEFGIHADHSDGIRGVCLECRRNTKRARKMKVTVQEIEEFLRTHQEIMCEICELVLGTHLDHDHVTGKLRGMLCQKCNLALGMFGDNIEGLTKAIDYLKRTT